MEQRRDEWKPTTEAEINAENESYITTEEIITIINEFERTAEMTLRDYKKAISDGNVKNYSIVQLKMWEEMECLLRERLKK